MRSGISVLFGKAKVNDIDLVSTLAQTHEKIVWFYISMDKVFGVNVFDSRDELVGEQENGLEGKLSSTEIKQVFEAGPKQVEDHAIVVDFSAKPADKRNANYNIIY